MPDAISVETKYPLPLTTHQLWMVSLCAPVNRGTHTSRTTLYPYKHLDDDRARRWLAEQWEIRSAQDVLGALNGLAKSGYRARVAERFGISPLAWDVALFADVVRNGFAAGFLAEADAWRLLNGLVQPVREAYDSWRAYADDYLLGRVVWVGSLRGTPDENFPAPEEVSEAHIRWLLDPDNLASPWNHAPWHVLDEPERPR
jgi:hypothetical protein